MNRYNCKTCGDAYLMQEKALNDGYCSMCNPQNITYWKRSGLWILSILLTANIISYFSFSNSHIATCNLLLSIGLLFGHIVNYYVSNKNTKRTLSITSAIYMLIIAYYMFSQ